MKFGWAFSFTVTTSGSPPPRISKVGRLPAGVTFIRHSDGTATIAGTPHPCVAGVYPLTLTAKNRYGIATQSFTLTVTRAPFIRDIHIIRAREGVPLKRVIRTVGYPAPALTESGRLPTGLSFSDNGNGNAFITGTPTTGSRGLYRLSITATNASGTATRPLILRVSPHGWR